MKELITEDTSSNMNKLSQGLLQQKRKVYREKKAVKGLNKRTNISNFGKLASQTKKLTGDPFVCAQKSVNPHLFIDWIGNYGTTK